MFVAIIDIGANFYFSSHFYSRGQFLKGLTEVMITVYIFITIVILWLIYFVVEYFSSEDFSPAWYSVAIIGFVLIYAGGSYAYDRISTTLKDREDAKNYTAWINRVENRHFESKKLGISFDYISESLYGKSVSVEEKDDVVSLKLGTNQEEDSGKLKVFSKDTPGDLLSFLRNKYSSSYSKCLFYKSEITPLPKTYEIVANDGYNCPKVGIEAKHISAIQDYYIMDKEKPNRYIFISLPDYPIDAIKPIPGDKNFVSPAWFETIKFD